MRVQFNRPLKHFDPDSTYELPDPIADVYIRRRVARMVGETAAVAPSRETASAPQPPESAVEDKAVEVRKKKAK